eukprot:332678-Alexandrium_andersonii.AAC.1
MLLSYGCIAMMAPYFCSVYFHTAPLVVQPSVPCRCIEVRPALLISMYQLLALMLSLNVLQ